MSLRKIIVNADDFGMRAEVNQAIVDAFEQRLISSTTLMANMPGFGERASWPFATNFLERSEFISI